MKLNNKRSIPLNRFLILLILLVNSMQAQDVIYQANYNSINLSEVLSDIEQTHKINFSFAEEDIARVKVNCISDFKSLKDYLNCILKGSKLSFEIVENQFILLTKIELSLRGIQGKVIDKLTDNPLEFANIYLLDKRAGLMSDNRGEFDWNYDFADSDTIVISFLGYESAELSVKDFKDNRTVIALDYDDSFTTYLEIKDYVTDGISLKENGTSTLIRPNRVGSLPGQVEPSVLASIRFLPGVNSHTSQANDIRIRGGTPDQNLIVWEDIPIYQSGHYFGMISAFNPFVIEKAEVYRNGFGAEYGGRLASVIDMRSGDFNTEQFIGVGSNFTHAYLYGHQYISTRIPTTINFSIRRSYDELFTTPTVKNINTVNEQGLIIGSKELNTLPDHIEVVDDFNFWDSQFKLSSKIGNKTSLNVSGLMSQNEFSDFISDDRKNDRQRDSLSSQNIGGSISLNHHLNSHWSTDFKLIKTRYQYDYRNEYYNTTGPNPESIALKSNAIDDFQIHWSGQFKNDKNQYLNFGYQWIDYTVDYQVKNEAKNSRDIDEERSTSSGLHNLFLSLKNPIDRYIGVDAGLRFSVFGPQNELFFEPRINLSYRLNDALSLHTNYGRHHQFVSELIIYKGSDIGLSTSLWTLADRETKVQQADVYQMGLLFNKEGWVIDLQTYAKRINGLTSRSYNIETADTGEPLTGASEVQGVDVLIKKRYKKLQSWLSYSFSKTEFIFDNLLNERFPSDFDQTHVLKWSNQYSIGGFEIALGLQYASGLPYSLINDFDIISQNPREYLSVYEGINTYRLDHQTEVNISVLRKFNLGNHCRAMLSASVTNVMNRDNQNSRLYYIDDRPNQDPSIEFRDKSNLGLTPNVSLRFEW